MFFTSFLFIKSFFFELVHIISGLKNITRSLTLQTPYRNYSVFSLFCLQRGVGRLEVQLLGAVSVYTCRV